MRIAPEGWPFIAVAWLFGIALLVVTSWVVALVWLPVAVWCTAFFRDPVREGPRGEALVIAPADGRVVSVIPIDEPLVVGGAAVRISIFMNVFDVHVNRYPANAEVTHRDHRHGTFFNAATEKAARENEQSDVGLRTPRGPMLVRQIAGLVARRIKTDHQVGHVAAQGERLGLIRFGSRVDVFLPAGTPVKVAVGDITRAGLTVIAEWP